MIFREASFLSTYHLFDFHTYDIWSWSVVMYRHSYNFWKHLILSRVSLVPDVRMVRWSGGGGRAHLSNVFLKWPSTPSPPVSLGVFLSNFGQFILDIRSKKYFNLSGKGCTCKDGPLLTLGHFCECPPNSTAMRMSDRYYILMHFILSTFFIGRIVVRMIFEVEVSSCIGIRTTFEYIWFWVEYHQYQKCARVRRSGRNTFRTIFKNDLRSPLPYP